MRDAQGRTAEDRGVMTDASGKKEGEEGFDFETATMKGALMNLQQRWIPAVPMKVTRVSIRN